MELTCTSPRTPLRLSLPIYTYLQLLASPKSLSTPTHFQSLTSEVLYITMWHLSWPKTSTTCTTKTGGDQPQATATKCIKASSSTSSSASHCTCLAKLVRKLRKQRRRVGCSSKSSSFQCRYDPLSYSLNFDASGCGNLLDDKDYYKFYAFSSRFVANPSGTSCSRLITTSTH